ncbi:TPA: restriction endonuclease subunit S [Vibrio harveyi]|uniref:restriction endonuclease subunit S n=1 Tax=Vibrio harveyi TaxID=669 RepID=UPI003908F776
MNSLGFMNKLLDGAEVEWKPLDKVFDIFAGGDVPRNELSDVKTDEFFVPVLSNGIAEKSLYGWTNKAKIEKPSLTISARGTIGWTSFRAEPFFPIVRLLVLTPKLKSNLKYLYYYMKTIENSYKVPKSGIPQLTKPMIRDIKIPIPYSKDPEKSLAIQAEIARILDTFTALTSELTSELNARKKQYNYYRDQLLSFESGEVEWKSLGEIGEFIRGKRFTKKDYVTDGGVKVIHYGEIYTHYGTSATRAISQVRADLAESLRYAEPNDVIVSSVSETVEDVGKAVAWLGEDKVAIHDDSYAIRHSLNPKYLSYCLQTENFAMQKVKHVSRGKVKRLLIDGASKVKIPVPFPNDPKKSRIEQDRIVAILDKFDTLTNSISEGLPREIELRQKQYEYYRDLLLSFPKPEVTGGM